MFSTGKERLYVLSGRLRLALGEESTVLGPGDAVFFYGMLEHAFDVFGDEDMKMLVVSGAAVPVATGRPPGGAHPLHESHHVMGERSQPSGEV